MTLEGMKWSIHHIVFMVVLTMIVGCTGDGYTPELRGIDTLIDSHPDSALALLDSLRTEKNDWSKARRMRYELLTAKAQNKAFVDFTTDSIAKDFTDYYDRHGSANDRVLAHYLLGCTYRDLKEMPHAIDCFLDATSKADTSASNCDYKTLSSIYSQLANMYRRLLLLSDEIKARKHSCRFAMQAKDTLNSIYEKEMIAGAYILQNKNDSAENILHDVLRLYRQNGYSQAALIASTILIYLYVEHEGKYVEAKKLIDTFEAESSLFNQNHELPPSKRQYYYYKGKYYEGINQLDSAEFYYRKVYKPGMRAVSQDPMYRGLLNVFTKRHQADSIAKYAQLYCQANDSSIAIRDRNIMEQTMDSYNYSRYQRKAVENENKFYHTLFLLIGLTVCFVLIIVATFIAVKRYKQLQERKRQKLIEQHQQEEAKIMAKLNEATEEYNRKVEHLRILEETHRLANIEATETISELRTEKDNYQAKYTKAQEAITESNANYEQERAKLTAEIASLLEMIESYKSKYGIAIALKKADDLEGEPIVVKLRTMAKKPKETITENDFILLEQTMCNYYPAFIHDLRQNPKYSNTDRQVCILTALKFRPGDIVNLTGLTSSKVTNAKEKLNLLLFDTKSASSLHQNLANRYDV